MKPDIDSLIHELHADNPDLAVEDAVLRAVLSELIAKQPVVAIEEAFRAQLRSELMKGKVAPEAKRFALPWWFAYTVPVGLTALLLLVIQPPYATAPVVPPTPQATPSTENNEIPEAAETDSFDAVPSMMRMETSPAPTMKAGGGDTMQTFETGLAEDAMMVPLASVSEYFTAEFTPDRLAVRITHLSLAIPAFVSVSGPEGVVAVSGLFLPGEHTRVLLPLSRAVKSGEIYTAVWYYDNGDGVYTEGFETLAVDWTGTPISMTFVAP